VFVTLVEQAWLLIKNTLYVIHSQEMQACKKIAKLLSIAGVEILITMGTLDQQLIPYLEEANIVAFDQALMFGKLPPNQQQQSQNNSSNIHEDLSMISNVIGAEIGMTVCNVWLMWLNQIVLPTLFHLFS